jgi:hypothetical protein
MNIIDGDHLLSWLVDAPLPEHRWISAIAGATGFHEPLMNKRVRDQTLFANDVRFLAVGFPATAVAVYVAAATLKQSPVLLYADVLVGFPTKGNGGDVIVPFSQGVLRV